MSDQNTHIRNLYSEGFSALRISYFKTNLVFSFIPYTGKDYRGLSQYSTTKFLSTSVNYDAASFFYLIAKQIIEGEATQMWAELPCLNNAALIFEHKPDENNQMATYLVINKNNEMIPFRFATHEYKIVENGQMTNKLVQTGLGVFVSILDGYLTGIGADLHLSKLSEEELNNPPC
jgi:hypothetical protein